MKVVVSPLTGTFNDPKLNEMNLTKQVVDDLLETHKIKRKEVYKYIIFCRESSLNVISDDMRWTKIC